MKASKEVRCIIDELPDRRIGMSAEDHALCPKCHPKVYEAKPQHTPTPWKTEGRALVIDQNGDKIANCATVFDLESDKANAAFIVSAVNSHEELLGIVKELYETVQFPNGDGIIRLGHIERMKQAIAKAEGKS